MQLPTLLATLALFLTASAVPRSHPITKATNDLLKPIAGRLVKALQNPKTFKGILDESCEKQYMEGQWDCYMGDRAPDNYPLSYTGEQMKTILEHAKAEKNSGVDFSRITVVSEFHHDGDALLGMGIYQLLGIFDGAARFRVYYGASCLVTENKQFPAKFKGMTINKLVESPASVKQGVHDAFFDALLHYSRDIPCIRAFFYGNQDSKVNPNFGEAEKDAVVVGL
jgi:hypothetical protein